MTFCPEDIPAGPLATMADQELWDRCTGWGTRAKAASRRALSLLPEIVARGLERRHGFRSEFEFGAKAIGASANVVEEVVRIYRAIGTLPELWGLLSSGAVGWSTLKVLAPIATRDNAGALAELAQRLSKRQLQEYVNGLKGPSAAATPGPALAVEGVGPNAGAGWIDCHTAQAPGSAPNCPLTPALPGQEAVGEPFSASSPPARADEGGVPAIPEVTGAGQAPEELGWEATQPALVSSSDPSLRRRTAMELRPDDERLLRDLQGEFGRVTGGAITIGELVGLLVRGAWRLGLPALMAASEANESPQGAGGTPIAPAREDHPVSPAPVEDQGCAPGDAPAIRRTGPAQRHAYPYALRPTAVRKVLEVVVRVAETGQRYMRGLSGLVALSSASLPPGTTGKEVILLADLYAEAVRAAGRRNGRHVPAAVERFVVARAMGACEAPHCHRPARHIHHRVPWAISRRHDPDQLVALCEDHHALVHAGAIANPQDEPSLWSFRRPGADDPSSSIDRAVQASRRAWQAQRAGA